MSIFKKVMMKAGELASWIGVKKNDKKPNSPRTDSKSQYAELENDDDYIYEEDCE